MTIEEAAEHYASVTDPEAHGIDFIREVFIAGAEWQKEQHKSVPGKYTEMDFESARNTFSEDVYNHNRKNKTPIDMVDLDDAFETGADWMEKQMMKEFPKWKKIKTGERLPCPAYVWAIAYDNYPDCFQGRLIPNIQGVKVGQDTWYLPVDVIHNLPKEE